MSSDRLLEHVLACLETCTTEDYSFYLNTMHNKE